MSRHVVAVDGSIVMAVGEHSPLVERLTSGAQAAVPVHLRATDVAPVALPERVRASVHVAGRLMLLGHALPDEVRAHLAGPGGVWATRPLLHLVPRRVVAQFPAPGTEGEPCEIDQQSWSAAVTDPLVGVADEWVAHLDAGHRDLLAELAGCSGEEQGVRAVSIDQRGIVLRTPQPPRHLRVSFGEPVACGCDLAEAVDRLARRSAGGRGAQC